MIGGLDFDLAAGVDAVAAADVGELLDVIAQAPLVRVLM